MTRAGEQRLEILEQRRDHQLVTVGLEQVEDAPAQRFDLPRLRREDIFIQVASGYNLNARIIA